MFPISEKEVFLLQIKIEKGTEDELLWLDREEE